jgi:pimeloyl-ACP methyl ester carboxylesterase
VIRVVYLHGFASSPQSSKATFLGRRLVERGVSFQAPDLNQPEFSTLTVSRMVEQTAALVDGAGGAVTLVGSSLGGCVAVQSAIVRPGRVERMVLLAPALDFDGNRLRDLGDRGIEEWKATGELNVFHHAYGRMCPVHYALYTDAERHNCAGARVDVPIQIFQGTRDTSVDPVSVERWASSRSNVELHLLDDGHQLTASLEYIWREMARFLGLSAGS